MKFLRLTKITILELTEDIFMENNQQKPIVKQSWEGAFDSLISAKYDTQVQLVSKNSVHDLPFGFRLEDDDLFDLYRGSARGFEIVIEDLGLVYAVGLDKNNGLGSMRPSGRLAGGLLAVYAGCKGLELVGKAISSLGGTQKPPRLAHAARKLDDKQYKIFISHSWTYDEHYEKVVDFLNEVPSLDWQDHSVPSTDPLPQTTDHALKEALKDQMRSASLVVVSAGMYGAYSDWIDTEIELAKEMGKPIIAIIPEGQEKVPNKIEENCTEKCRWRKASLIESMSNCAI